MKATESPGDGRRLATGRLGDRETWWVWPFTLIVWKQYTLFYAPSFIDYVLSVRAKVVSTGEDSVLENIQPGIGKRLYS